MAFLPPAVERDPRGHVVTSWLRQRLWRAVLAVTGGFRVSGSLPAGGCVVVANHNSHADTAAMLAALPASARPVVAAAADYWAATPTRAAACRALAAGFPVRRGGGGSADLSAASALLAQGRAVVIYPEGTRSCDGTVGAFRSGALRLAAEAGVPVVPVAITGTRKLLAPHGSPSWSAVAVTIGEPMHAADPDTARKRVMALLSKDPSAPDSRVRQSMVRLANSRIGLLVLTTWALAEAISWPIVPEIALAAAIVALPRRIFALTACCLVGSVVGGLLAWQLAASGWHVPLPLTNERMRGAVHQQVDVEGASALRHQPLSGVPYKVYAAEAGAQGVRPSEFATWSAITRGARMMAIAIVAAVMGSALVRFRRFYGIALILGLAGFGAGLAKVISYWS